MKVMLRSYDYLLKNGFLYKHDNMGGIIVSNKHGSYKTFGKGCFEQEYYVSSESRITIEVYEAFKSIFVIVK